MEEADENESRERALGYPARCPRCGGNPLTVDRLQNHLLCTHCGYTVKDFLPDRRVRRLARSKREGAEAPLSRSIGRSGSGKNFLGRSLFPERLSDLLQAECLISLYRLTRRLNLSDEIRGRAVNLLGAAGGEGMDLKRKPVLLAGAAVYLAGKMLDALPLLGELTRETGRPKKEIQEAGEKMTKFLEAGSLSPGAKSESGGV